MSVVYGGIKLILLEKYINKWNDKNNKDFIDELFYLIGIGHKKYLCYTSET